MCKILWVAICKDRKWKINSNNLGNLACHKINKDKEDK